MVRRGSSTTLQQRERYKIRALGRGKVTILLTKVVLTTLLLTNYASTSATQQVHVNMTKRNNMCRTFNRNFTTLRGSDKGNTIRLGGATKSTTGLHLLVKSCLRLTITRTSLIRSTCRRDNVFRSRRVRGGFYTITTLCARTYRIVIQTSSSVRSMRRLRNGAIDVNTRRSNSRRGT